MAVQFARNATVKFVRELTDLGLGQQDIAQILGINNYHPDKHRPRPGPHGHLPAFQHPEPGVDHWSHYRKNPNCEPKSHDVILHHPPQFQLGGVVSNPPQVVHVVVVENAQLKKQIHYIYPARVHPSLHHHEQGRHEGGHHGGGRYVHDRHHRGGPLQLERRGEPQVGAKGVVSDDDGGFVLGISNPNHGDIYQLSVDESISALTLHSRTSLEFVDPNLVSRAKRRRHVIKFPSPGTWTICFSSSFTIKAKSHVYLSSFRFLEPRGRPGHTGYFPITEKEIELEIRDHIPVHGYLIAVATFSHKVYNPSFRVHDADGNDIFERLELVWRQGQGRAVNGIPEMHIANVEHLAEKIKALRRKESDEVVVKARGEFCGRTIQRAKVEKAFVRRDPH